MADSTHAPLKFSCTESQSQLTERLTDLFRATAFANKYTLHPRRLDDLGREEAHFLQSFLATGDRESVKAHGRKRLQEGLGESTVMEVGALLRRFCWDRMGRDANLHLLRESLLAVEEYWAAYLEGYMEAREAEIFQEQEQIRRALSAALERQRRELHVKEHAMNTSINGIMLTDVKGRIEYVNPAFLKMWGIETAQEVVGQESTRIWANEEFSKTLHALVEGMSPGWRGELPMHRVDGSQLVVEISGSSVKDPGGNPMGSMVSFMDVTDRKRLEEEFWQAGKMEAIGTLAGGIAHDFNNILMGIQGYASLMLFNIDPSHTHYEDLRAIEKQVESGAELTRQLLAFARRGRYDVRTIDLTELIDRTANMFGRTKKEITIHKRFQNGLWPVEADQGQMEQVLLNLYVNAWQAMPSGGVLYLETQNVALDADHVRPFAIAPGNYVRISVADTGMGMDEATQKRIFEPFFTTQQMGRGTGLGLASVYGIVKNHGGLITVHSRKGHGAKFEIHLPASVKKVTRPKTTDGQLVRGTETILLVDDEKKVLDVAARMLGALGYEVLACPSGRESIELYRNRKPPIDLVILDMIMPDMGGGQVYDILKKLDPQVKVILSSGYSKDGQATDILGRGCNGFIHKPFNLEDLSSMVRQVLDGG